MRYMKGAKYRSRKTVNYSLLIHSAKGRRSVKRKGALMKRLAVINWRNLIRRLHKSRHQTWNIHVRNDRNLVSRLADESNPRDRCSGQRGVTRSVRESG